MARIRGTFENYAGPRGKMLIIILTSRFLDWRGRMGFGRLTQAERSSRCPELRSIAQSRFILSVIRTGAE